MTSTDRRYFVEQYAGNDDPWGFRTSEYERRKYEMTLAKLPRGRYQRGFEPGCSLGVLSELLASRCDYLLSSDIIPSVLESATERLADFDNVVVESLAIPEEWPDEEFDLVVLSEIAYYFDPQELDDVLERLVATTVPGAHVIAVHWRGVTNYPLSGDMAHDLINRRNELRHQARHLQSDFVLDLWERRA